MFSKMLKEFATNSSMHGVKYLVDKNKTLYEKAFWVITLLLGGCVAVYILIILWTKYRQNTTYTLIKEVYAPTTAMPFPAVTVCNYHIENVMSERYFDLSGYHNQSSYDNKAERQPISSIYKKCEDMFIKCSWMGKVRNCTDLFTEIVTFNGICCTFNYLYSSNRKVIVTPFTGYEMGLTVLSKPLRHDDSYAEANGVEVTIHSSDEFPTEGNAKKAIDRGKQTFLSLDTVRMMSSEQISQLPVEQRNCVFSEEKTLKYFKVYTFRNCKVECFINISLWMCNCSLPPDEHIKVPLCGNRTDNLVHCLNAATDLAESCDCPVKCENVDYTVISTSAKLVIGDFVTSSFVSNTNVSNSSALFHVFFNSPQVVLWKERKVSILMLLWSFGGIFSLFLGLSFVTVTEVVYYFFIRYFIWKIFGNTLHTKKGQTDIAPPQYGFYN